MDAGMTERGERGFALIAVLWALVIVGALAGAYLAESRHVVRTSANRNAELQALHVAVAGVERAQNVLERLHALSRASATQLDVVSRSRLTFVWNHLDSTFAEIAVDCLGSACYDVRVRDLRALLNVNRATESQLRDFFGALGAEYRQADIVAQSIADWIDPDDLHRARGAEDEYYLGLHSPYRPRNGPVSGLNELRRVRGMDERLFQRAVRYLSVDGDGRINLNAAPGPVLAALPGADEEIRRVILSARERGVVFSSLFELSARLSPQAQERLEQNYREFARLASFEPRQIEVRSEGRYADTPLRVAIRATYVRTGDRVTQVKRLRLDR
jgi:general secretion pathway protein K